MVCLEWWAFEILLFVAGMSYSSRINECVKSIAACLVYVAVFHFVVTILVLR